MTKDEVMAPLNGVGTLSLLALEASMFASDVLICSPDFKYYHPIWRPDPNLVTLDLWNLHIKHNANDVITNIIHMNVETIKHIQTQMAKYHDEWKKRSCNIIHESTLPNADAAAIRAKVKESRAQFEDHEAWSEVLEVELELSEHALARMESAKEGAYEAYREYRPIMVKLVEKLYEMTGSAAFVKRHRNELWDVIDRQLE